MEISIVLKNFGGGIQVTGSHNPPDMNGYKLCLGRHTLSGKEIQDLYQRMASLPPDPLAMAPGVIREISTREEYVQMLVENSTPHIGKRKLKVVVDGGNGVGGLVGPTVLRKLGVEVIELFCDPDGNFPNHHPDPTLPENLEALIKKVRESKADFGIGWDGDADRIGVVDEKGEVIYGDMLVLLFAREILKEIPNATIIGDVKCSTQLFEDLKKRGANPLMWKTGHSLIKAKLHETKGALAGEMSGHIFFNHRYFGFDDALYASCRFVELVSNSDKKVSELLADIPKMISTPEIRVDCPDDMKFAIVEQAKQAFSDYVVDTTDGARITMEDGWALVRASNTQPVLVMRFEARTKEALARYQSLVKTKIEEIKTSLG